MMLARMIYSGLECEFLDEHYRIVRGVIRYVYVRDNSADVELPTGEIRTIECDRLRSAVYHPEGTGKLQIKRLLPSKRRTGPFMCATCHTALTKENAPPSDVRNGGKCRACRGAYLKAHKLDTTSKRRKETGE